MHPLNIVVSRIPIHRYSIQLDPWVQNIQRMHRGILKDSMDPLNPLNP